MDINKLILKYLWKDKDQIINTILKENKVAGLMLPDFKLTTNIQ